MLPEATLPPDANTVSTTDVIVIVLLDGFTPGLLTKP